MGAIVNALVLQSGVFLMALMTIVFWGGLGWTLAVVQAGVGFVVIVRGARHWTGGQVLLVPLASALVALGLYVLL
jgi:hypothetical protein